MYVFYPTFIQITNYFTFYQKVRTGSLWLCSSWYVCKLKCQVDLCLLTVGQCLPFPHLKSFKMFLTQDSAWILIFLGSPMVWSSLHDEMLCREIMFVDLFTWTKEHSCERKEMGRGRWKLEPNWSCLFQTWQKGISRSLQPSPERTEKQIEKSSIEVALEEFSVLFLYSCNI